MDDRSSAPQGSRNAGSNSTKLLTILGSSARIEGKFQIAESIEVQCEITGELDVGDTLVIGDRGRVAADVTTVNAVIIGSYQGNLKASASVEIAATGRVSGTIESAELVIAKGAVFTGTISHIEKQESPRVEEQSRPALDRSVAAQPAAAATPLEIAAAPAHAENEEEDADALVSAGSSEPARAASASSPASSGTASSSPLEVETPIPVARLVEVDSEDRAFRSPDGPRAQTVHLS